MSSPWRIFLATEGTPRHIQVRVTPELYDSLDQKRKALKLNSLQDLGIRALEEFLAGDRETIRTASGKISSREARLVAALLEMMRANDRVLWPVVEHNLTVWNKQRADEEGSGYGYPQKTAVKG